MTKKYSDKEIREMLKRLTGGLMEDSDKVLEIYRNLLTSGDKLNQYLKAKFGKDYDGLMNVFRYLKETLDKNQGNEIFEIIILFTVYSDVKNQKYVTPVEIVGVAIATYFAVKKSMS